MLLNTLRPVEGLGAQLSRISWALNRAEQFDLEPVFSGPFSEAHAGERFDIWAGFTNNSVVKVQDPDGFQAAQRVRVPLPFKNTAAQLSWFDRDVNRVSVIYDAPLEDMNSADKVPLSRPVPPLRYLVRDDEEYRGHHLLCPHVRRAIRAMFWSVPEQRNRCRSLLSRAPSPSNQPQQRKHSTAHGDDEPQIQDEASGIPAHKHHWVVGVHMRRGDIIPFRGGSRNLPHAQYAAMVRSVLRGIVAAATVSVAEGDPGNAGPGEKNTDVGKDKRTQVSIIVFSEGTAAMEAANKVPDENNIPIVWDIQEESCEALGLACTQVGGIQL